MKKKRQQTGTPGRPREVEIYGGHQSSGATVERLSGNPAREGATGVERLSGSGRADSTIEIIPGGKPTKR